MKIKFTRKHVHYLLITLAFLIAGAFSYYRTFDLYELQTYDWRCQIRGPRPVSDKIVLVEIDNFALEEFGWPMNRQAYGRLIDALKDVGAASIVFDILFAEPQEANDPFAILSAQLAQNTYFPIVFFEPHVVCGKFASDNIQTILLPSYASVAKGVGFVNTTVDVDGKRRRTFPLIYCHGKPYLQLGFKIAADFLGISQKEIRYHAGKYLRFSKDFKIPLDEDGYFIVNYASKWADPKGFKHSFFTKIMLDDDTAKKNEGKIPPSLSELKGKICIIGLTATGSHDINPTPLEKIYPMMGQYANVLNSILQKDFIRRLDRFSNFLILILSALLVWVVSVRLKPLWALGVIAAFILFYLFVAVTVFALWGSWIDLFYPLVLFTVVYTACTLSRVLSEMRKRQLIENELKIASQIQRSFLPENPPTQKGLSLSVFMKPAKQVGGDLYAFITLPEERLGVMVGDVSGKGTPAALFMAKTVSEFKFVARDNPDPADVLTKLNNTIAAESTSGLFVTSAYVIFDLKNRKLVMTNGGHLPVVTVSADGQVGLMTAEEGMPIGVMEGVPFANFEQPIRPGDCFVLYSDGISEARNRKADEYGIETLQKQIGACYKNTAADILKQAVDHVTRFIGKADQHDDMTLIVVKIENPEPVTTE